MIECPLSDEELTEWADEHLAYEAWMLAFASLMLARPDLPRDEMSNVFLESFAIHARCLRDFLFGHRDRLHKGRDAFAIDFCPEGEWENARGPIPAGLSELDERRRYGREIVHLSYDRSAVSPEMKDWPIGRVLEEIDDLLRALADTALPERLSPELRETLRSGTGPGSRSLPVSVATLVRTATTAGTIAFPLDRGA